MNQTLKEEIKDIGLQTIIKETLIWPKKINMSFDDLYNLENSFY